MKNEERRIEVEFRFYKAEFFFIVGMFIGMGIIDKTVRMRGSYSCLSLGAWLLVFAIMIIVLVSCIFSAGSCLIAIPCAVFVRCGLFALALLISRLSLGAHEAPFPVTDEVLSACTLERFPDERGVLGAIILQKCPLQLLFVIIGADVYLLLREGVDTRIIHHGRDGSRSGIKVLHLLGREMPCLEH